MARAGLSTTRADREGTALRIVALNQYYPPDTSATAVLAREAVTALSRAGHEVTVVAGRPSYHPAERHAWRLLRVLHDGHTRVERVGSLAFSRGTMAGRVANYLSYLPLALLRALTIRADVLLAMTDPPVVVVIAALAARVRWLPLVYNVRDLHPDMAAAAGLIRPGMLVTLWEAMHRWALRRATRVIVLGDDMKRRIIAKGVAAERVTVVRDGAELLGEIPPREGPVSREVRRGFPLVVMHAGNLGFAGAWETLLGAARQLRHEGVGFVFVGGGAAAEQVRQRAAGLDNVRFLPPRPAADVPALLAAGDLQIVTLRRGLEGLVVPSKLYPILGVGRPVLAVVPEESDVATIVRAARCGWVVDPDDPAAVAAAVREAMQDPVALEQLGRRARAAAPQFARGPFLSDFARVVDAAASCQAGRPRA